GSPDMPSYTPSLQALQEAARLSRLQVRTVVARTGAELETAFSVMARDHVQAVLVLGFGPYIAARQRVADLALKHRLPTFFSFRNHVEAGGLMSYGPDFNDLLRRAALYLDKILKGAKPAHLPRRPPRRAAHQVRIDHQPQDRQGAGPDDPAIHPAAGRPDHRVARARPTRPTPVRSVVVKTA